MLYYYLGVIACDVFNLVSAEYIIFSILLYVHDIVVGGEIGEKMCWGASDIECTWKTRIWSKWTTIDIFYCHYLYIYMKELLFVLLNSPCNREAQLAFCPSLLFFYHSFSVCSISVLPRSSVKCCPVITQIFFSCHIFSI